MLHVTRTPLSRSKGQRSTCCWCLKQPTYQNSPATWRINTKILSTCRGGGILRRLPAQLVTCRLYWFTDTCVDVLAYLSRQKIISITSYILVLHSNHWPSLVPFQRFSAISVEKKQTQCCRKVTLHVWFRAKPRVTYGHSCTHISMVLCTKVTKQSISGLDIFMRSLLRNMLCPEERKLQSHKR